MAIETVNQTLNSHSNTQRIAKMRTLLDAMENDQTVAFYTGNEWVVDDPNEAIYYLADTRCDPDAVQVVDAMETGPQILPSAFFGAAQEDAQVEMLATI